jgi:hypothetical protein
VSSTDLGLSDLIRAIGEKTNQVPRRSSGAILAAMKVRKQDFDAALAKLLRAGPLPMAEIPRQDGAERGPAKPAPKPTRKR